MSSRGYEKLKDADEEEEKSNNRTQEIESKATDFLKKRGSSQQFFFRKSSTIDSYLKSARENKESAKVALALLRTEAAEFAKKTGKTNSKTMLVLLKEIYRYGNGAQIINMCHIFPEIPVLCLNDFRKNMFKIDQSEDVAKMVLRVVNDQLQTLDLKNSFSRKHFGDREDYLSTVRHTNRF